MIKRFALMVVFAGVAWCQVATAEEDEGWLAEKNFSGAVSFTTDYVYRGVSQTESGPAVQGGVEYASPVGAYAGVWGSNVAFGGGLELDASLGFANEVGGFSYDVGAVYYAYPEDKEDPELDYLEFTFALDYKLPFGGDLEPAVGFAYGFSPEYAGEDGASHAVEVKGSLALPAGFSLSAAGGWQTVEGDKTTGDGGGLDGQDGFDYLFYRVGLSFEAKGFTLDLSWHGATESDFHEDYAGFAHAADPRLVFTLSREL